MQAFSDANYVCFQFWRAFTERWSLILFKNGHLSFPHGNVDVSWTVYWVTGEYELKGIVLHFISDLEVTSLTPKHHIICKKKEFCSGFLRTFQ